MYAQPLAPCMQGNCTNPPPAPLLPGPPSGDSVVFPMLPLRQNQCLILLNQALMKAVARLWLDGLYIRVERQRGFPALVVGMFPGIDIPLERRGLWMTDVTIQGDTGPHFEPGRGLIWGVVAEDADLLSQGACCVCCGMLPHLGCAC